MLLEKPLREARVHRFSMGSPDDTSAIAAAVESGRLRPEGIVAILAKTEGNGCVNDFSRGFAVQSLRLLLSAYLDRAAIGAISIVMSGGTEGAIAPHWIVFEKVTHDARAPSETGASLAMASIVTQPIAPEDIGRPAQAQAVAEGVRTAMEHAGIARSEDVHYVQIKCPLLTQDRIVEAEARGQAVATRDTLKSMGFSRGASSLGVAIALGEVDAANVTQAAIGLDFSLYSTRASASAGIELMGHEILVLGMSESWCGDLAIDHAVMEDNLDTAAPRGVMTRLGLDPTAQLSREEGGRLVALLAKAEAAQSGRLRGYRHTMLNDSDISQTRHARGFVAGVLAGLAGHAEIFVSGGAEHQGPDGGGPCAMIVRRRSRS